MQAAFPVRNHTAPSLYARCVSYDNINPAEAAVLATDGAGSETVDGECSFCGDVTAIIPLLFTDVECRLAGRCEDYVDSFVACIVPLPSCPVVPERSVPVA